MQVQRTPNAPAATPPIRATASETFDLPRDRVTLGQGEPAPDLQLSRLRVNNPFPRPGEPLTFRFAIANTGDADAGAFSLRFAPDFAPPLTARLPEGLKAGTGQAFRVEGYHVPGGRFTYQVTATADSANDVRESREDNNSASLTLHAPPEPPPPPPIPPPPIPPRP